MRAGAPAFGRNVGAYAVGGLGLYGIVFIMLSATKRLDGNQLEKYGGQPSYEAWRFGTSFSCKTVVPTADA